MEEKPRQLPTSKDTKKTGSLARQAVELNHGSSESITPKNDSKPSRLSQLFRRERDAQKERSLLDLDYPSSNDESTGPSLLKLDDVGNRPILPLEDDPDFEPETDDVDKAIKTEGKNSQNPFLENMRKRQDIEKVTKGGLTGFMAEKRTDENRTSKPTLQERAQKALRAASEKLQRAEVSNKVKKFFTGAENGGAFTLPTDEQDEPDTEVDLGAPHGESPKYSFVNTDESDARLKLDERFQRPVKRKPFGEEPVQFMQIDKKGDIEAIIPSQRYVAESPFRPLSREVMPQQISPESQVLSDIQLEIDYIETRIAGLRLSPTELEVANAKRVAFEKAKQIIQQRFHQ